VNVWHFGAAAVFSACAALQFNDPDPIYWILVYGGTAVIALARGLNRYSGFWTGVCAGAIAVGLLSTAAGFGEYLRSRNPGSLLGDMESASYVEQSREFLGLTLALILLLAYAIGRARRRARDSGHTDPS